MRCLEVKPPTIGRAPSVQRVSLSWFSELGVALKPLSGMGNVEKFEFDQVIALYTAKNFLDALADSRISHLQLRASREPIRRLLEQVDAVLTPEAPSASEDQFKARKFTIAYMWEQLSPVLHGELTVQNCYLVWPKRAYDIEMLAESGVQLFASDVQAGLSEMERYDINQ